MSLTGGYQGDANTSSLTDPTGRELAAGRVGGDQDVWNAWMGMLGGWGGATALSGGFGGAAGAGEAAAGGGAPLGIEGASYAVPGAESSFGLANTGAAASETAAGNGAFLGEAAWTPTAAGPGGLLANAQQALSPITKPLGQAAQWMKENPILGRLVMSVGGGLLGGLSGGQGAKPAAQNYGPPTQWNSPIKPVAQGGGGLLTGGPQQQVQQGIGSGLLGPQRGVANNGAWQWMRGN